MHSDEFINSLKADYDIIRVLSNKNESLILLLKHKNLKNYLVLRKYITPVPIYNYLKQISYVGLPMVYDTYYFQDGQIVLEQYIDGTTIADELENRLYTFKEAKKIIIQLCYTLSILHKKGIVHRDIKPENVIIDKYGNVKLIDFNASRIYNLNNVKDTVQIGTIGYAPPEQFGIAQTDARTDIYAIGVLLNIMLTGNHPSKQITSKGKGIVTKCTQINPDLRFQTVDELISKL